MRKVNVLDAIIEIKWPNGAAHQSQGASPLKRLQEIIIFRQFIYGLPEDNPEGVIKPKGFSIIKNIPASKIKEMYFHGLARAKNVHPFWGIIRATV